MQTLICVTNVFIRKLFTYLEGEISDKTTDQSILNVKFEPLTSANPQASRINALWPFTEPTINKIIGLK